MFSPASREPVAWSETRAGYIAHLNGGAILLSVEPDDAYGWRPEGEVRPPSGDGWCARVWRTGDRRWDGPTTHADVHEAQNAARERAA